MNEWEVGNEQENRESGQDGEEVLICQLAAGIINPDGICR